MSQALAADFNPAYRFPTHYLLARRFSFEGHMDAMGVVRWVSPVFRAPIPAALCHSARPQMLAALRNP